LIIATPFSAIMMVDALVLVEVTAGITGVDDSEPLEPVHRQPVIDNCHRVRSHRAGAARMTTGAAVAPRASCSNSLVWTGEDAKAR
jgi:hypothetical protein